MDASESKSATEEGGRGGGGGEGGGRGGGSVGALPKAADRNPNQEEEGEGRGRGQGRGEGEEEEVEVEEGGGGGRERNPNGRKGSSFAERLAARSNGSSNSNNNSNSNGNSNVGRSSSIARFKIIPRSNCLTIPPGLSPATLLDSPVLLSSPATGQAEPSPTTGTFPLPPIMPRNSTSPEDSSPGFAFKPFPNSGVNSVPTFANLGAFGFSHQQALAHLQAQVPSPVPLLPCQRQAPAGVPPHLVTPLSVVAPQPEPLLLSSPPPPPEKPISPVIMERPSDDGFNWRKYGQKQVKGSEFPRSYYKCTFPSCPVKKKVECSADGQVTEIVYKGEHNHPKPLVTRRVSIGTATTNTITTNNNSSDPSSREGPHNKGEMDSRTGRIVDPLSSSKGQLVPYTGGASGADEQSSGSVSDDDGEDGDDEEPDSKRRKEDKGHENVAITPLRTIREPRVVVQTTSEVDILDDGYRWRKYGQKVVKGNPHPRSYYKCTNLGCSVRKHVERSSTDAKAVITTYEGKHNHDVPAARNGGTHDSGGGSTSSVRQTILATGTNASAIKPPSQPPLHDQYFYEKPSDGRSSIALLPSSSFPPPNSSFHQGVPQRVVLGP